jgi:hypothetical protein
MERLASGPHALASGPVGRCSSRGWIRYVGMRENSYAVYELTSLGRAKLEENDAGLNPNEATCAARRKMDLTVGPVLAHRS